MALNLVRNSRVFFTTNVNSDGVVNTTNISTSNTWEIQVLDGLSFSQATTSETVTVNEAGATPTRGQRSFNTALNPVEFSMSTYIRPKLLTAPDPDEILAEERFLWNAFAGVDAIGTAAGAVGWTTGSASSTVAFTNSNKHQFQKFGLIIVIDGAAYLIDNCSLNQASIDFGLDAIATIAWSGQGTALRQLETVTLSGSAFSVGLTGTAAAKVTDAKYLANKLSTVTIQAGITGTGTQYTLPVTGGNITFANNITYLTPANLGIVNQPITYFSGTRAISGSLNCYLRTNEENSSADLLNALLTGAATDIAPGYEITISIGGSSGTRVVITMPAAVLQIPSVNTEQVVSTTINFTAQGSASTAYDITAANEAEIKYYATA
jgi:hypothetical protein